jgi:hypothetical protein
MGWDLREFPRLPGVGMVAGSLLGNRMAEYVSLQLTPEALLLRS